MSSSSIPRKTPTYATHSPSGLVMSADFDPDHLSNALSFTPADDDVFICTYPKCGTTWMQCILHLMRGLGRPLEPGQNINDLIPHIETDGPGALLLLLLDGVVAHRPRVIKTHLPHRLVPKNPRSKYVVVARNPKDCCVSFYHHTKGFVRYYDFAEGSFDDFFELFLEGRVDFNDYFDHLLEWVERRNDPNILFLLYEEMKSDIKESIRKIGTFLGGVFLESVERPDVLERIVEKSSLRVMAATPDAWSTPREERFAAFIRKGEVGDWRTHFSEDQCRRMDEKVRERLGGTAAEHLWDEFDC